MYDYLIAMANDQRHGEMRRYRRSLSQLLGLGLGPVVFLFILFSGVVPDEPVVGRMAAVAALMAIWWITDAIPLAATALLPVVLYPLMGIMKGKEVASVYFNHVIFLFIGGS